MSVLISNITAFLGDQLEMNQCHLSISDDGRLEIKMLNDMDAPKWLEAKAAIAEEHINGSELVAMPSFMDLHAHFREPGFEVKETLESGQLAAIKGGVTKVCIMPNTKPCIDRPERLVDLNERLAQQQLIDVYPVAAITLTQAGEEITNLAEMTRLGAKAYSDDGRTVMDEDILRQALVVSRQTGYPVMTHSEDHDQAALYPDQPYPPEVEGDIVARDIEILNETGGKLHIAHLSTKQALNAVIEGKRKNLSITYEIAPHHLYFDADLLSFSDAKYKVNPPLRGQEHIRPLIESIRAGHCDAIASDHAPHELESKRKSYREGSYGFTGIETMFSAVHTVFRREQIGLKRLIELMSVKPREILNIEVPYLINGVNVEMVLVNPDRYWTVKEEDIVSKSANSPFIGETLVGTIEYVFYRNRMLLKEGNLNVSN